MRIAFDTKMSATFLNRSTSRFRFAPLQKLNGSGRKIYRPADGPIGGGGDQNFGIGMPESSNYMKNINQALSRLDFLERVLAEASYRGALDSAARMIHPASLDNQQREGL